MGWPPCGWNGAKRIITRTRVARKPLRNLHRCGAALVRCLFAREQLQVRVDADWRAADRSHDRKAVAVVEQLVRGQECAQLHATQSEVADEQEHLRSESFCVHVRTSHS